MKNKMSLKKALLGEAAFSGKISSHIEEFIRSATRTQLIKMEEELSKEIEKNLVKDSPQHSYTAELELIKSLLGR